MALLKEFIHRLRFLAGRSRFDAALDDEIQFHMDSRAAELREQGLSEREAAFQARREFGSPIRVRGETRSAWQFHKLENLAGDLRLALRAFRRSPVFALTAAVCLAIGIGGNTVIFGFLNNLIFRTVNVAEPQTLVRLRWSGENDMAVDSSDYGYSAKDAAGNLIQNGFSYRAFEAI